MSSSVARPADWSRRGTRPRRPAPGASSSRPRPPSLALFTANFPPQATTPMPLSAASTLSPLPSLPPQSFSSSVLSYAAVAAAPPRAPRPLPRRAPPSPSLLSPFPRPGSLSPLSPSPHSPLSNFIPPPAGPSLAARRLGKKANRHPPILGLQASKEDDLPGLMDRLSLKRKSPPALKMTPDVRKKARYIIVVTGDGDDDEDPETPVTPLPPSPLVDIEIDIDPVPSRPRRPGPQKRVRFADELDAALQVVIR